MSAPVSYAELEIGLSAGARRGKYRVRARFENPRDAASARPAEGNASIDFEKSSDLERDRLGYGRALAASVFRDEDVARLFDSANAVVGSSEQFLTPGGREPAPPDTSYAGNARRTAARRLALQGGERTS